MSIDSIANFLTIIRNGIMASRPYVVAPYSRMNKDIAQILKDEGFIKDIIVDEADSVKKGLKVVLKYVDGESVIHEIKRVSRPGLRAYAGHKKIKPVIGGLGLTVLTTNKGLMTHKEAKHHGIGGEVVCTVW